MLNSPQPRVFAWRGSRATARLPIRTTLAVAAAVALSAGGCGGGTTAPTATRTPAAPSTTESFRGTLGVGGSRFYSFSITQYGTVNITLNGLRDAGGPSGVTLGLGLGAPSGTGCTTPTTVTTASGTTPQLTAPHESGVYCVRIYDVGNLAAAIDFDVSIAHP